MKIASINNYQTNPRFSGASEKKNKLKNLAGATIISLAAAAPLEKADAQIYYYPPVMPYNYYVPAPPINSVPDCFVVGDIRNFDANKSMGRIFSEIDSKGVKNNLISADEVVRTEQINWNSNYGGPYTVHQKNSTRAQFNTLSRLYNEENSNPNTINFNEYKAIMRDYMEAKNINNFIDLIQILTIPGFVCPPSHHHVHPPHHHHHRH